MLLLLSLFCVSSANSSLDSNEMVKLMLLSPGLLGRNEQQAEQMRQIVPFMILDEDASRAKSLIVLMTTHPHINPVQLLPFLLLDDEIDLANLFVTAAMMQSNCQSTNTQFNQLLPLMLIDNVDAIDANMKTMLLMQTLSEGNTGLDLDLMLPYLLMENESETDNLLLMVMMNAITGGMDTAHGFDQNFNVLLPLLFRLVLNVFLKNSAVICVFFSFSAVKS